MKKSILSFNVLRVHTEHSYVQNAFMEIRDSELGWELAKKLQATGVRFYKNHFTVETEEGAIIGYNDGIVSIGVEAYHMPNSKVIELTEPLHILLGL
jgi:hypothetical protein